MSCVVDETFPSCGNREYTTYLLGEEATHGGRGKFIQSSLKHFNLWIQVRACVPLFITDTAGRA
jgi:hypothetical protein